MPKVQIDFSKTIIYKIVHKEDPDNHESYTGHTTEFAKRKCEHKKRCLNPNNKKYHYKVYQYIRENGGWDNFIMLEIEKYPCNDGNEARARENYWYNELKSKLNTYVPSRTPKQYYQDNRDELSEYYKQYHQDNREKILEQKKQYYEENRDKRLEKNKQYNQENRENISERKKQHYQENREKILDKRKQKITCDICGSIVRKSDISTHKKSKKCINTKK